MSIVVMQVFVSLMLVAGSLVLFLHSVRQRDLDHADRLALAPLDADDGPPAPPPPTNPNPTPETASGEVELRSNEPIAGGSVPSGTSRRSCDAGRSRFSPV